MTARLGHGLTVPRTQPELPMDTVLGLCKMKIRTAAETLAGLWDQIRNPMRVDPTDAAVQVLLSTRTEMHGARAAFAQLKRRFPKWSALKPSDAAEVLEILRPLGFANKRWDNLCSLLAATDGGILPPGPSKTVEQVLWDLTRIRGIGPKVARCVMLYAWHMPVCPADAHGVRFVNRYLGLNSPMPAGLVMEIIDDALNGTRLHYSFHMNMITLGRRYCTPNKPDCESCPLKIGCAHSRGTR